MKPLLMAKESLSVLAKRLALHSISPNQKHASLPTPRAVQLVIAGRAPIQLVDADTGRVLGFRQTYQEASRYARLLERGAT